MHSHFTIAGSRFPLADRTLDLAGTAVTLSTVPYSPAELDRIVELVGLKERAWPYWLEDWPATYALAEVLAAGEPERCPGPVLDLGCGSGILGAYLGLRFGVRAYGCDFNGDACRLALMNIRRNRPEVPDDATPSVAASFGAASTGAASLVAAAKPDPGGRVFCADFRAFPARARFGLILGGEMLYAAENQGPILAFLDGHLAQAGSALFADPGRSAAEGFPGAAGSAGFHVETRTVFLRQGGRRVDVHRLRRMAHAGTAW